MSRDPFCTCHPVEAPQPCPRKYAYNDCLHAAKDAEIERLRALVADLTKMVAEARSQPGLMAKDADNERLRAELRAVLGHVTDLRAQLEKANTPIWKDHLT